MEKETVRISPQKVWLPLTMVIGLVLAVIGGTVWINDNLYELKSNLTIAIREIEYIKQHIERDSIEIKKQISGLNSKSITNESFRDWAKLLKAKNPDIDVPLPGD